MYFQIGWNCEPLGMDCREGTLSLLSEILPTMKNRMIALVLVVLFSWSAQQAGGEDLVGTARDVADGVGTIQAAWSEGHRGPVFVFEEVHTSRIGQHQIAVMLLRLHERESLRLIGLEGSIQSSRPLDVSWFHRLGAKDASTLDASASRGSRTLSTVHQDVALRMLGEGEISAAEFIAMVFGDVRVCGLELAEEYNIELNVEGAPAALYLIRIAEKSLTQADIQKINELALAGKQEEAVKYLTQADAWVRKQFEAMNNTDSVDLMDTARRMREIRAKARKMGISVDRTVDDDFDRTLEFFDTASKRSVTMAHRMTKLVAETSGGTSAMIIGAAHSKEVQDVLEEDGVSYVLLRPQAFNPDEGSLSLEQFERKNRGEWARIGPGTIGRLLNGIRKPAPFIESATAKSYASALFASKWIAGTVRRGGRIPEDLLPRLKALPECVVHFDSIEVDGYDAIVRMTLKNVKDEDMDVWLRIGSTSPNELAKTLEQKLLQQISDLGASNSSDANLPPRDPPKGTDSTGCNEGPGDGRRGDKVVTRVSDSVVAVFTESAEQAKAIGRISS